jgi:hypothetical protein
MPACRTITCTEAAAQCAARASPCAASPVADASASSPDSSEIVPTLKPQPDGALVKALAREWRWHKERVSLSYTQRAAAPCH